MFQQQVSHVRSVKSRQSFPNQNNFIPQKNEMEGVEKKHGTKKWVHVNLRVNLVTNAGPSFMTVWERLSFTSLIMNLNRYSLFLKEILLLLPVRLYSVLRQKLHELQRLFDFYQNLINFTAFDLWEEKKKDGHYAAQTHSEQCFFVFFVK